MSAFPLFITGVAVAALIKGFMKIIDYGEREIRRKEETYLLMLVNQCHFPS